MRKALPVQGESKRTSKTNTCHWRRRDIHEEKPDWYVARSWKVSRMRLGVHYVNDDHLPRDTFDLLDVLWAVGPWSHIVLLFLKFRKNGGVCFDQVRWWAVSFQREPLNEIFFFKLQSEILTNAISINIPEFLYRRFSFLRFFYQNNILCSIIRKLHASILKTD